MSRVGLGRSGGKGGMTAVSGTGTGTGTGTERKAEESCAFFRRPLVRSSPPDPMLRAHANASRFDPASTTGHYESWFQRANHPSRPLAFWIRYTIFMPRGRPEAARGELWAIVFDGERDETVAVYQAFPIGACRFGADELDVRVADAMLTDGALNGEARSEDRRIAWALRFDGGQAPLLLLPRWSYEAGFPKAKALVGRPACRYTGTIQVGDRRLEVDDWLGSQNHNWGSRHTDRYAWGQVAGFDDAPEAFLECLTGRVRLGPIWSPWLTLVVVRLEGEEIALNGLARAARAKASLEGLSWHFESRRGDLVVKGHMHAPAHRFVGLRYANPPGGEKICLNSKLASCTLELRRGGRAPVVLETTHRAAFEMLGEEAQGIAVVAG